MKVSKLDDRFDKFVLVFIFLFTVVSTTASTTQSGPPGPPDPKWSPKHSPSQPDGPGIQSPPRGNTSPSKAPLSPSSGIAHRRDIPAPGGGAGMRSPSRDPYGRRAEANARADGSYVYATPAGKAATLPARYVVWSVRLFVCIKPNMWRIVRFALAEC